MVAAALLVMDETDEVGDGLMDVFRRALYSRH
jgi:hypothetical protein